MATVADHVISALRISGVRRVYGLPGDSLNGFTDALRRSGEITWEHVRHEETAGFAAAADAALTGQLAVCAGSCGPGNLHLINGLFDAQRSRVPVLAIAAHIPRTEIGSEYFQETHPQELFRDCSVYRELVSTPEMAPRILEMAMRAAVEERGVAVVVIPGEIFLQRADASGWTSRPITPTRSMVRPDDESLRRAAEILNGAEAVTILGGAGVEGSHDELIQAAATLSAPIVHALRGKDFIEYDNPFDVGMTGLLGFASGYKAIKEADALLMLGTDFPYQQFYPDNAKVVQVDVRGRNLGRRTPIDLGLVGTVKDTLAALQPLLRPKSQRDHLDRSLRHYSKTRKTLDELAVNDRDRTPIRPEYVAGLANQLAADDAVFTVDVGSPVVWAARYLKMNGRRRLVGSFNHGTMACALPLAIGAQTAFRNRQVVAPGRRRRPHDDVRRTPHAAPEPVAGQGDRLQQLVAELRRTRDEGCGHRQLRHRADQSELRRCRAGDGDVRPQSRAARRPAAGAGRRFRVRRACGRRRRDRPTGAVDTARDHRRTGEGLLVVRDPHHPGRPG